MANKSNGVNGIGTLELPQLQLPNQHPCHECGACCKYLALEIDDPSSFTDYENTCWYLTHRGVSVYIDWEGDWYLEFETVCEHLSEEATCGIYEERPKICSDFSWNECEKTTKESAWKYRFTNPTEMIDWVKRKRPKAYTKYQAAREKLKRKRSETRKEQKPARVEQEATA